MSESLHNMDDLFKKALQENTDFPSESVWDNIDKNLDKKNVVSTLRKYNKLKWVAAALLFLSSAMAIYTFHVRNVNRRLAKYNTMMKQKSRENKPAINNLLIDSTTAEKNKTQNIKGNFSPAESQKIKSPELNKNLQHEKTSGTATEQSETLNSFPKANKHTTVSKKYSPQGQDQTAGTLHLKQLQQKNKDIKNLRPSITGNEVTADKNQQPTDTATRNSATPGTIKNIEPARLKNIEISGISFNYNNDLSAITLAHPLHVSPELLFMGKKRIYNNRAVTSTRLNFGSPSRFSLNIFYSPDISFKKINNNHPRYRDEERDEIEKDERVQYASTAGINLGYNFKSNWQIKTGISYSTVVTNIFPKTIYARPDNNGQFNYRFNCSAGYSYINMDAGGNNPLPGDSINSFESNNKLAYINVPLSIGYSFNKNRWSIIPSAGVSMSFLVKGQIKTTVANNSGSKSSGTTTIEGLKKSYMNGLVSVAAQYHFSKVFALSFEPTTRFGLEPINKDASVNTVLNSFGFAAGLVIKL